MSAATTVEISAADANLLVEAGVRYALPRMTGISSDARAWLEAAEQVLEPETRREICDAIRNELVREHSGLWRPEREDWNETLDWLEQLPDGDRSPSLQLQRRSAYTLIVGVARYGMRMRSLELQRQYAKACACYASQLTADEQGTLVRDIDQELKLDGLTAEIADGWRELAASLRPTATVLP